MSEEAGEAGHWPTGGRGRRAVALRCSMLLVAWLVFFITALLAVQAIRQDQPRCAMRGICGQRHGLEMNCPYSGSPKALGESSSLQLRQLCPQIFDEEQGRVCCDEQQVDILVKQMTLPRQLLGRCPACFENFVQVWCAFACSPRQGQFVKIIDTTNNFNSSIKYITRVQFLLTDSYITAMLNSCRNVRALGSEYALTLVCGTNAQDCTPQRWKSFSGTANRDIGVPIDIDIIDSPHNDTMDLRSIDLQAVACSEMTRSGDEVCSCQDCPSVCTEQAPFPMLTEEGCKVATMDCMVALSLVAFGGLCAAVMFMSVLHYVLRRSADTTDTVIYKSAGVTLTENDIGTMENLGAHLEQLLEMFCAHYGQLCARRPLLVLAFGLSCALFCSSGMLRVRFTTDPVELWSSPGSRARLEKQFFDENFSPFYRTCQLIVYPRDQTFWPHTNRSDLFEPGYYGPAFRKSFLKHVLALQSAILSLRADMGLGYSVSIEDICFQPMQPGNRQCALMSVLNYFQNNATLLDVTKQEDIDDQFDFLDHILSCARNPFNLKTELGLSCLASFGGPIQPYVTLGDFNSSTTTDNMDISSARGLVITLLINNHNDHRVNRFAELWEAEFIRYLRNVSHPEYALSFMAERSIQDEIERESKSDAFTILISYMFMFGYVAFALGQYQVTGNNLCSLLVHSKMLLGVAGVLIVALSVTSSIGVYAFYGIPATMIILEVQPFLVLAVGVDNIFIFVQAYQRMGTVNLRESLETRIGRISGEVMPSMLLSSLAECLCFFLGIRLVANNFYCSGALSSMPAVKVFSLYAALAIFFDFFLQVTCFLALFTLDIRREEAGRPELCCCSQLPTQTQRVDGYTYTMFNKYYAPVLLTKCVRVGVILVFLAWICSSLAVMNRIELGLDQKMAVPEDSYVLSHFNNMDRFLSVGPPVYFVVKGNLDYSIREVQDRVCSHGGCLHDSLGGQIAHAAKWSNRSYIAHPVMNWLDDYVDWLRPMGNPPCCRYFEANGSFCPATVNNANADCLSCSVPFVDGRPRSDLFYKHLDHFLHDNPSINCARGGHAAYGSALNTATKSNRVLSSYFMTYHTVLKRSPDFINAMASARVIAEKITVMLNDQLEGHCPVQVFPYSIFYVFYEQYSSIVSDAIIQLILSLAAIFVVTTVLMGLDPWSAVIIVLTISAILLNLIGLMYWWSIDFNAISVVNLVMSVGISVEFCSHIVRAFAMSIRPARVDRAREALATMGSSVLSGITLTKFGGIIVLAFAHSQIFKVFYFRMFFGIVVIGAAHGLVLLPVVLSFVGPPVNKRKLLVRSQTETELGKECGVPLVSGGGGGGQMVF